MAGHSKWANIKHKKEKQDSKRGKIFTKLGREIAVAVKQGGADPLGNAKLKDVIAKAKFENMPNDTITRNIKKASGEINTTNYEEITYEGYGPAGVAVIVETMTDNRNRTAADVRHYFDKYGGNLGTTGCVTFMFEKKGLFVIEKNESLNTDELMLKTLDAGAEEFEEDDEYIEIITQEADFSKVLEVLEQYDLSYLKAEVSMIPNTTTKLETEEHLQLMDKLIDHLEDLDDVQKVFTNIEE